jgi:uncharacterized protein (DUF4213/DUF364 family)
MILSICPATPSGPDLFDEQGVQAVAAVGRLLQGWLFGG